MQPPEMLSLYTDFENFSVFKPAPQQKKSVNAMLDHVIAWGGRTQDAPENVNLTNGSRLDRDENHGSF